MVHSCGLVLLVDSDLCLFTYQLIRVINRSVHFRAETLEVLQQSKQENSRKKKVGQFGDLGSILRPSLS